MSEPRGRLVGIVDEYGTVWSGEPGATRDGSRPIGDLVVRDDDETGELYLEPVQLTESERRWLLSMPSWTDVDGKSILAKLEEPVGGDAVGAS